MSPWSLELPATCLFSFTPAAAQPAVSRPSMKRCLSIMATSLCSWSPFRISGMQISNDRPLHVGRGTLFERVRLARNGPVGLHHRDDIHHEEHRIATRDLRLSGPGNVDAQLVVLCLPGARDRLVDLCAEIGRAPV